MFKTKSNEVTPTLRFLVDTPAADGAFINSQRFRFNQLGLMDEEHS